MPCTQAAQLSTKWQKRIQKKVNLSPELIRYIAGTEATA
jgi:hypothetical protein